MSTTPALCLLILIGVPITIIAQNSRKLICLDNKADLQTSLWTAASSDIGAATSVTNLPKGFGDLKALGSGSGDLWYFEGPPSSTTPSKDIVFKAPLNMYTPRASKVTIYMKYYSNSQRRLSLYPVKEGVSSGGGSPLPASLQLLPLPPKGGPLVWNEISKEIDRYESPLEITAHLASKEFLIFDKIVVAVDAPLPSDLGISCGVMRAPPVGSPSTQGSSPPPSIPSSPTGRANTQTTTQPLQCPQVPAIPECKCNCLCNCSKC